MRCKLLVMLGTFLVVVVMGLMPVSAYLYMCPADGRVTCPTGCMCAAHGTYVPHRGVDIANSSGPMVGAAYQGKVTQAEWVTGYGRTVVIKHSRGLSPWLTPPEEEKRAAIWVERWTRYAHLASYSVEVDDPVTANQDIGRMGNSDTTAVHLHWEVRNTPNLGAHGWYHIGLTRGQQVSRGQYVWVEDGP